ncbi:hypothetical protein IWQ51_001506 [Labrenzia sp. EL_142]|nr:hypothetical protein [Labrenzia sp. EL_142]
MRFGWGNYNVLSETWGAGEALFGALIDPEDASRLKQYAAHALREAGNDAVADWAEGPAVEQLQLLFDKWIDDSRAVQAPIIGASVGALQLCGSIYLMKRLQERGHSGLRVLGGSGLVGQVAQTVLNRVSQVDFIVNGEGEVAFEALVRAHLDGDATSVTMPGVLSRTNHNAPGAGRRAPAMDLSRAPAPDLSDFYDCARRFGIPNSALTLSFEHSRGCEWEHRTAGQLRGCTFCGLYRTAPTFRRKPTERIADQIQTLANTHRSLNLAFVDAYLPEVERDELLDTLNRFDEDITFFSELRCDLTLETAKRIAKRARHVQLGVESFSTAILKKIGKGVSAAHSTFNIRICQELGVPLQYNLMVDIPGVTINEIETLAASLPTLFGLVPPQLAQFYLDRNSLMFFQPEKYGLCATRMDTHRHDWLPHALGDNVISQIVTYTQPSAERDAWRSVEEAIQLWKDRWQRAREHGSVSPLSWRGGKDWATISDLRGDAMRSFDIEGVLFEVFAACEDVTTLDKLVLRHPSIDRLSLTTALEDLVELGLIFRDGTRHVRTAIHADTLLRT